MAKNNAEEKSKTKNMSMVSVIKTLFPCVKGYGVPAILSGITIMLEVVLEIFIPFLMARIIDVGIPNKDIGYIAKIGGLMVLFAMLSLLFGALSARFASVASTGFAKGIREAEFKKIQDFSFYNVDRFSSSSLITRLTTDVTNTQMSFMMVIRTLVRAPLMLIGAIIMATAINGELTFIFLAAIPVLLIALALIMSKAHPRFQFMLKKFDKLNSKIQEALIGIRVVKAFVRGDYEEEKFEDAAKQVRDAQVRAEKIVIFNMPIMQLMMFACIIAILWFGGNMIIAETMQIGQLISFISYVSQILMSLMMISMIFVMLVISRASMVRISEVLNEKIDIDETGTVKEVSDGSISFNNVSFSYFKDENNLVLEDINLNIASGETIGIIGGTGSAKTTLVQLIPRLYDVTLGNVCVGGRDVKDYDLVSLRDAVAMVLQKNVLFSGTIRENLRWGDKEATDEEIVAACESAQAHDFIMSFPNGYDTELGQGGVNLSGGQKQRLCIARALLKKPKIIILDDSTSAVDTATDKKIRDMLAKHSPDVTKLIIAQRIDSVKDADRIIVIDEGRICGFGTHSELMQSNEIYREVYDSQQKGADEYAGA